MRCILGSGKRDVHEIEILGTSVRWTEEGLSVRRLASVARHCWKGWDRRNPRRSTAQQSKPEEAIGQEDGEMLEETEKTRFKNAELHESGQVGRATRRERDMHEDGESDTCKRKDFPEGMRILV